MAAQCVERARHGDLPTGAGTTRTVYIALHVHWQMHGWCMDASDAGTPHRMHAAWASGTCRSQGLPATNRSQPLPPARPPQACMRRCVLRAWAARCGWAARAPMWCWTWTRPSNSSTRGRGAARFCGSWPAATTTLAISARGIAAAAVGAPVRLCILHTLACRHVASAQACVCIPLTKWAHPLHAEGLGSTPPEMCSGAWRAIWRPRRSAASTRWWWSATRGACMHSPPACSGAWSVMLA